MTTWNCKQGPCNTGTRHIVAAVIHLYEIFMVTMEMKTFQQQPLLLAVLTSLRPLMCGQTSFTVTSELFNSFDLIQICPECVCQNA